MQHPLSLWAPRRGGVSWGCTPTLWSTPTGPSPGLTLVPWGEFHVMTYAQKLPNFSLYTGVEPFSWAPVTQAHKRRKLSFENDRHAGQEA